MAVVKASDFFLTVFGIGMIVSLTLGFTFSWIHDRELKREGEPRKLRKVASSVCDFAFYLFGGSIMFAFLAFVTSVVES
jgi:NhaP-type Na+/H+ or K+/H+ antiporter